MNRVQLLLVEDNPGDARLLRELLGEAEPEAFAVTWVDRLADAEALLERETPDAILLDLSLPDGQGIETVRAIQAVAPAVPILVLTGLVDQDIALQAVKEGAQDYLIKGEVGGALVARAIRYAMERKLLEEERLRLLARERAARAEAEDAFERVERARRQRDEVLQMVTHDLRNPLSGIVIGAAAALMGSGLPEDAVRRVSAIQRAAERMNRLVQDLLNLSSIELGRLAMRRRPIEIEEVLREAVELLGPQMAERGLTLDWSVPDRLPMVAVDRDRVHQVLSNLLANAIRFCPDAGRIGIAARRHGAEVRVTVSDSGPGIPEDECTYVFDRFWHRERGRPTRGAGIGLAIAQGIVTAHGGRIWVESRVGEGSHFHFTLPLHDADEGWSHGVAAGQDDSAAAGGPDFSLRQDVFAVGKDVAEPAGRVEAATLGGVLRGGEGAARPGTGGLDPEGGRAAEAGPPGHVRDSPPAPGPDFSTGPRSP